MAKLSGPSKGPTGSAPAHTTRRTRSQSAEPAATAPEPATTSGPRRRGAQRSRAGSEQPEDVQDTKKAAVVADLTTVEEDEDDEDDVDLDEDVQLQAHILAQSQSQAAPALSSEEPEAPTAYNRRRISTGSAISGTTAKTSFSAEEIEQMDAEVMIDLLPSLANAADGLARFLAPDASDTDPARWKDIRSTGTKLSKLYQNRQASFGLQKRSFGSQEYIRPRTVLRALLAVQSMDDVPEASWRPDNILFKANLAEMLNTVLVVCDSDEWTSTGSDALERLHSAFPDAIAGSEYSVNTLGFYLDLTAQLTIHRMEASIESEPNFSPHHVVDSLFYDENNTFRHMEELGLMDASENDRNQALELINQTAIDLKQPFPNQNGAGAAAANGKLKAKYRWDALKMHTLKYYEQRTRQLEKRIVKAGGVAKILRSLTQEVERRVNQKQADQIRKKSLLKPESTPRASLAGITALKRLEDSMVEQGSEPSQQSEEEQEPAPREEEPLFEPAYVPEPSLAEQIQEMDTEPVDVEYDNPAADVIEQDFATSSKARGKANVQPAVRSDLSISSSFQDRQRQRLQKSAEKQRRRFIDPQPNAIELEWNEEELSQRAPSAPPVEADAQFRQPGSARKGKRTFVEMDEEDEDIPDPTQDEGFQMDTRDTAAADRRRKEVSFPQKSRPAPRYRSIEEVSSAVAGPSNYASSTAPQARPSQSPNKRQRLNPGSSVVPITQPAPEGTDLSSNERFARAKIYARQHTAVNAMNKPQQQRRPWTDEEEKALIDLIEEHGGEGISYATLKGFDAARKEEAKLSHRSSEDLRFKARNMKVTFLLGDGNDLPRNWEYVVLDKKAITKLHDNGIPYEQERQRLF